LERADRDRDGRLSREEFPGPKPLFDRMDRNGDGIVTREEHESAFPSLPDGRDGAKASATEALPSSDKPAAKATSGGLLYFASYRHQDDTAAAANPHIAGALFTIYWSDVETREGVFDWSAIDRRIAPWLAAGKKVALRIMWSSSGTWPDPAAGHPTPQFVIDAGAVTVRSESSRTDIPLAWDPVYVRHSNRFLREVARKFDGNPNVLFVDVTPGAETNPYRFRRINAAEPEFKRTFARKAASDGRTYSHELWLETVKKAVDDAAAVFRKTPLLVTLNVGSLDGPEQSRAIGDHCVARGCYVGQNGLTGRSYAETGGRTSAFAEWGTKTKLYFEMLDASGGGTGSLMDVMKAAERIGCDFLGVYAVDVLRGTRGQDGFDPDFEAALAYGARTIGEAASAPAAVPASPDSPPAATPAPGPGSSPVADFRLNGERWVCGTGDDQVSGILVKPEGKGPHPAILISHGLGGSAESFGLLKAREFVKMGLVCIAPDYTHSARAADGLRGRAGSGAGAGAPPGRGGLRPDFGASAENIRRARLCIDALRAMPEVDAKRIATFGHSMGGFVTIGLAASATNLIAAAAITGSGIALQDGYPAPSEAAAQRIRTPFLMIHGADDTVVRPAQSGSLEAILDRNGVPNERTVYPGEGHPIAGKQSEIYEAARRWFERHGVLPIASR
jgi:dienelactone hydrolase